MTIIDRHALLPHSAEQLFGLVADIERYPDFLAGCNEAVILSQEELSVVAKLGLSRAGFSHSFVTRNTLIPFERIELRLVDGPFERFEGHWHFKALGADACKVQLTLDFQLKSGLMNIAAGKLFDRVALDLVDAVVKRAEHMFGKQIS